MKHSQWFLELLNLSQVKSTAQRSHLELADRTSG